MATAFIKFLQKNKNGEPFYKIFTKVRSNTTQQLVDVDGTLVSKDIKKNYFLEVMKKISSFLVK